MGDHFIPANVSNRIEIQALFGSRQAASDRAFVFSADDFFDISMGYQSGSYHLP